MPLIRSVHFTAVLGTAPRFTFFFFFFCYSFFSGKTARAIIAELMHKMPSMRRKIRLGAKRCSGPSVGGLCADTGQLFKILNLS